MKITKFHIQNYRAIEDVILDLAFSINPIIGVNESGKTSVLKAVLAFDKNRDRYNSGEHLEFKNKYFKKDNQECRISSFITLTSSEIEELIISAKVKTDSEDYKYITENFTERTDFILTRILAPANIKYEYLNENISASTRLSVERFLVSQLPSILYFDDFSDRVPDEISLPADYSQTGKLKRHKLRDWQEILEEIFKRADPEGIEDNENPLMTFLNIQERDKKTDILSDIEDVLNKEIIEEWKKIKESGKTLGDDTDNLILQIECFDNNFQFKVRDKSYKDKKRTFRIEERSKGFQWFFNYMIKLKFNPNYKTTLENSIFLLDEPGSYLHSAAQAELLNELKSVSDKNTIIYCTHSQFLLNPAVIKLGSIKIAEKIDSKISLIKYGNYHAKNDKGALSPIYQALQLNFANDFIGKIVLTEGITDYYLFKLIQIYTELIDESVKIIPGSGAKQSSSLLSLAIPFADDFVLLLDNDKAGLEAKKHYVKQFGEEIDRKIHVYQETKKRFLLEDFLSGEDQKRILEFTNSKDIKRALGFLFFDYKNKQKEFIQELSDETLNNISPCIEKIRRLGIKPEMEIKIPIENTIK